MDLGRRHAVASSREWTNTRNMVLVKRLAARGLVVVWFKQSAKVIIRATSDCRNTRDFCPDTQNLFPDPNVGLVSG